jgi:hypothetical protein
MPRVPWRNGRSPTVNAGTHPPDPPFHGLLLRSYVISQLRRGELRLCGGRVWAFCLPLQVSIPLAHAPAVFAPNRTACRFGERSLESASI